MTAARILAIVLLSVTTEAATPPPDGDPIRGEALAGLAGCGACHTAEGGTPFAGGYAIVTDQGTFYGSNLTPDPKHGIGDWTYSDFERSMKKGRSPDGYSYWPAFPYPSFSGFSDRDLRDLWAYLRSLPPAEVADVPHTIDRGRWILGLWRRLYFTNRGGSPPLADPTLTRGQYLTEVVGHCGECHTPRGPRGNLQHRRELQGTDQPPEPAPPIRGPAVASWTDADWLTFLELGMTPDGDFVGGEMARVVREGTSRLSESDRAAMAAWLRAGGARE